MGVDLQPPTVKALTLYFILYTIKNMQNELLEKWGIPMDELQKMQKKVDDVYYTLAEWGLYGDIYYRLQKLHGYLDDFMNGEYLDEDKLDEIGVFYENYYKN